MDQAIEIFFRQFELACNDAGAAADVVRAFAENFLYTDGEGAKILPRAAISVGISKRRGMMAAAGFGPSVLERIDTQVLDQHYAQVTTLWRIDPVSGTAGQEPIYLRATYLVEVREAGTQIVAYLSHTDLRKLVERHSAGVS